MKNHLFLYGTLLTGASDEVANIVRQFRRVGEAYVRGKLYDLGEYPGAVADPSSNTSIRGELVELPPDQELLEELDRYEEFYPSSPEASLFVRKRTRVKTADGRDHEAWIYIYNKDPGDAPIVRGGDYSKSRVA